MLLHASLHRSHRTRCGRLFALSAQRRTGPPLSPPEAPDHVTRTVHKRRENEVGSPSRPVSRGDIAGDEARRSGTKPRAAKALTCDDDTW